MERHLEVIARGISDLVQVARGEVAASQGPRGETSVSQDFNEEASAIQALDRDVHMRGAGASLRLSPLLSDGEDEVEEVIPSRARRGLRPLK